jgi:hypothetical protein
LKLNKLRSEISTTSANLNILRTASFAQPVVGLSLQKLLSKGLNEVDIVELADILFEGFPYNNSSSSTSNKDTNKQTLIEDLKKYGSINSVLQELFQQANRLRGQIDELQKQKQHLEVQNQKMLYTLANSEPIIKFLHRSNDSFDIDKENVKILAFITFILNILYVSHSPTEELLDNDLVKLTGQMSRNIVVEDEQTLPIPQLKMVIIKALNVLIAKLYNNDSDRRTDIVPD